MFDETAGELPEELVLAAFQQSVEPLAIADSDGVCRRPNQAWCDLVGRPASELVGRLLVHHIHADDAHKIRLHCAALGEHGQLRAEVRLVRPDGRIAWIELSCGLIEHGSRRDHILAHARDTSAERWEARHRQQLTEEAQRTQQLRSLVRMGGGIAHEFNNMLAIIVNYAEFAGRRRAGDPRLRADLDQIERAAMRCASLTRQLMIFTRCDHVEPEPLEIDAVVEGIVALLVSDREGVDVDLDLGASGTIVQLPPSHAEQLLSQLVTNACEALPETGRLTITTARTREVLDGRRRECVRVVVEDDGCGMSAEALASAFDPFWTSHPDGTHAGLGLTLAQGIVERAGGRLELHSEPGKGTRVTAVLPATVGHEVPTLTDEIAGLRGHGERVLVVDDELALRQFVANVLDEAGYVAVPASAEEALARHAEAPVQLLVADVVMPVWSGPRLAIELRSRDPDLKILFISGFTEQRLARSALPAETWRFLAKPFDRNELLRAVRDTLDAPVRVG